MKAFTIFGVNVNTNTPWIDQVTDFRVNAAANEVLQNAGGLVYNQFVGVGSQAPALSFSSTKLSTILAAIGITGLKINPSVLAYFQQLQEGGTRLGSTQHVKMTVSEGIVIPRTISAGMDRPANINLDVIATYNGTNDPVKFEKQKALAGTPLADLGFVCGPISINGTPFTGVQDVQVDFGIQPVVQFEDGHVWPKFAAIMRVQPSITFRCTDMELLQTLGILGNKQTATNSVVYLRKMDKLGSRAADNVSEHISFTVDDGRISLESAGGGDGAVADMNVRITPIYDGTNAPLVIGTAVKIE